MSMRKHGWKCPECKQKAYGRRCAYCYYDALAPKIRRLQIADPSRQLGEYWHFREKPEGASGANVRGYGG